MLDLLLVHSLCSSGARISGRHSGREEYAPFRDCTGQGVEEDVVLGLLLVQFLCSSGARVKVLEELACWVSVVVVDHFYIALFSALEQTHCARM